MSKGFINITWIMCIFRYDSQMYAYKQYQMQSKSRNLARSKEELKNQLLMSFRKKNNQEVVDLYRSQQPHQASYLSCSPNVQNYSHAKYYQNSSILDQFSRCPIRDDQVVGDGVQFLKKFMYTKNRIVFPTNDTASVSVQTQLPTIPQSNPTKAPPTTEPIQNSKTPNKQIQTPTKIAEFNPLLKQKQDKSIIDVSANLSNMKFPISANKNEHIIQNRMLSDSLLQRVQSSQEKSNDSAKDLLKQLEDIKDESLEIKKVNSVVQGSQKEGEKRKQPLIKKIQLYRSKNKGEVDKGQAIKQNTNKNITFKSFEEDQSDQKLQKILSKKSELKNLIVKKNQEQAQKSAQKMKQEKVKQQKNIQMESGKWSKPIKKNSNMSQNNTNQGIVKTYREEQSDPIDLLPPYQTSSSGLQAVIEQENQSQMEQSVKYKSKPHDFQSPNDIIRRIFGMQNSQSRAAEMNITESKKKPVKAQKEGIKILNDEEQDKKQNHQSSQSLKQISLGDLDDVSQIQITSENKKLPETYKKIGNPKQDMQQDLPDYEDSENEDKNNEIQKMKMHKYIVNDISNDINNLKAKISKQSSFKWEDLDSQKLKGKDQSKDKKRVESEKGSDGLDKKQASMLDFFDEVHDNLDFGQISKDINQLRDRIANDSQ